MLKPFSAVTGSGPISGRNPAGSMLDLGLNGCAGVAAPKGLLALLLALLAEPNGLLLALLGEPKGLLLLVDGDPNGLDAGVDAAGEAAAGVEAAHNNQKGVIKLVYTENYVNTSVCLQVREILHCNHVFMCAVNCALTT